MNIGELVSHRESRPFWLALSEQERSKANEVKSLRIILLFFMGIQGALAVLFVPLLLWGLFVGFPFTEQEPFYLHGLRIVELVVVIVASWFTYGTIRNNKRQTSGKDILPPIVLSVMAACNLIAVLIAPTGYSGPRDLSLLQLAFSGTAVWFVFCQKKGVS